MKKVLMLFVLIGCLSFTGCLNSIISKKFVCQGDKLSDEQYGVMLEIEAENKLKRGLFYNDKKLLREVIKDTKKTIKVTEHILKEHEISGVEKMILEEIIDDKKEFLKKLKKKL